MKYKNFLFVGLALVLGVTLAWAGTVSEKPYGIAFPKWYGYSSGAKSTYYLEHPTLTANDQVVTEDATQTLTNKALTSPTITGGSVYSITLNGEDIADDTIDDDSIDFTDVTLLDFGLAITHDTAGELDALYEAELDDSAGLLAALDDETGSGVAVFSTSPSLVTPILGTITSGVGTALTALNGENIQDDTIDEDAFQFGTGTDDFSASDLPDEDLGDVSITSGVYSVDDNSLGMTDIAAADYGDVSVGADGTVTLDADVVSADEMANADHGDVSWSSGVASVEAMSDDPVLDGSFAFGTAVFSYGTSAGQDAVDVDNVNVAFIDATSFGQTIGGFTNGVSGQVLYITVKNAAETVTLEHNEGAGNQDLLLDGEGDVTLNVYEGVTLVCDGTDWYEINR